MTTARQPRRIKYADVAATLALALALSTGGAFAAGQIGSNDIAKNAVKSKHIANGQVKTKDLKANAVKGAQVKDGSLTGADLADGGVTGADVADGSLGGGDLAARVDGVAMAGVTFTSGGAVVQSFNRVGGAITVLRTATGVYDVTIPGTTFNGFTRVLASLDGSIGDYCYVNNSAASTVQVHCRTIDGDALSDSLATNFILFRDSTGVARTGPTGSATAAR